MSTRPDCLPLDPELAARLATRAALGAHPATPVRASEARWVLGLSELAEPSDARDGWAPWSSWLDQLGATAPPLDPSAPVATWAQIAQVLGVSATTVARRRRDRGDQTKPWFRDAGAVHAWWQRLIGPLERAAAATTRRSSKAPALDREALARELFDE